MIIQSNGWDTLVLWKIMQTNKDKANKKNKKKYKTSNLK